MSRINDLSDEWQNFERKVDEVMKLLQQMSSNNSSTPDDGSDNQDIDSSDQGALAYGGLDEDTFIVKVRDNRTVINTEDSAQSTKEPHTIDKFTFMQQFEQDAAKRAENRRDREIIADNFRKLGNEAFKDRSYEEAINFYTKAIDHIKDSPILYNNRALSCIKLKLYKRAMLDCDLVISRLDEKNLRSLLYRAVAFKNLDDKINYEKSIKLAKKNNPNDVDYIDKFIKTIKEI